MFVIVCSSVVSFKPSASIHRFVAPICFTPIHCRMGAMAMVAGDFSTGNADSLHMAAVWSIVYCISIHAIPGENQLNYTNNIIVVRVYTARTHTHRQTIIAVGQICTIMYNSKRNTAFTNLIIPNCRFSIIDRQRHY